MVRGTLVNVHADSVGVRLKAIVTETKPLFAHPMIAAHHTITGIVHSLVYRNLNVHGDIALQLEFGSRVREGLPKIRDVGNLGAMITIQIRRRAPCTSGSTQTEGEYAKSMR
jgi:hypothetical protein